MELLAIVVFTMLVSLIAHWYHSRFMEASFIAAILSGHVAAVVRVIQLIIQHPYQINQILGNAPFFFLLIFFSVYRLRY